MRLWDGVRLLLLHFLSTAGYEVQDTSDAMQYLSRFGYIGQDTASSMNIIDASAVIQEFQKMAGLNRSGVLDAETLAMMNLPRCGNKDMAAELLPDPEDPGGKDLIRRRRYKLSDTRQKWRKRELTYRVTKFSDRMDVSPQAVERDVARALALWEEATNLRFIRSSSPQVDIELAFATARHHDNFPFDGPGRTLAHAFSPGSGLGGDIHFDDTEMSIERVAPPRKRWSVDSPRGTNVLFVALHEAGHSLGLSHSSEKGAIMQAFYGGYRPHLKLHPDDVAGIQALYGRPEGVTGGGGAEMPSSKAAPIIPTLPVPKTRVGVAQERATTTRYIPVVTESATLRTTTLPSTTTTRPGPKSGNPSSAGFKRPDLCEDGSIDAITKLKDGNIYAFKGFYVFLIDGGGKGVAPGWPKRLEFVFPGLEGNIDAALTREDGKTFFFKGGKYFRFDGFKMDPNYPKAISKHFPGILDYVDSAFVYPINKHIYFTKGDKYWRFDPWAKGRAHVSDIYPLPIAVWKLPLSRIDASLDAPDGSVYFFKGQHYWKFNTDRFSVEEAEPKYPRLSGSDWFGCKSTRSGTVEPTAPNKILRRGRQEDMWSWKFQSEVEK